MARGDALNFDRPSSTARRSFLKGTLSLGFAATFAGAAVADKLSCMPVQRMAQEPCIAARQQEDRRQRRLPEGAVLRQFQDRARRWGQAVRLHLRTLRRQQRRRRHRTREPAEFHRQEDRPDPSDALGRTASSPASSWSTTPASRSSRRTTRPVSAAKK